MRLTGNRDHEGRVEVYLITSGLWFVGGVYCLMCCNGVGGGFGVVMIVICLMSECGFIYLFIYLLIFIQD